MFSDKKLVIYFLREKLRVITVSGSGATRKVKQESEQSWTKDDLPNILLGLGKKFGGPFYVIVDDDLAFVLGITIPADVKEEKDFVRIKAAENIPEEIGDHGWDFKEMLRSKDGKEKVVQFVALDQQFYADLSAAAKSSGIKIEAVEPMVLSLARSRGARPDPELIIHRSHGEEKSLVFLAHRGLVFFTENFAAAPTPKDITKFLIFIKETIDFTPQTIFLSGDLKELDEKTPELSAYKIEKGTLDFFGGISTKPELNIVLDVALPSTESVLEKKTVGISETAKNEGMGRYEPIGLGGNDAKKYQPGKVFTYAILFVSLFVIVANGIFLYQTNKTENALSAQPDLSLPWQSKPVVQSSPAVDLKAYSIEILNGSGKAGAARAMADNLSAQGFSAAMVANASSPNATSTTISYKTDIPTAYREAISAALSIMYNVIDMGSALNPNGKVDVMIVIGEK